MSAFMDEATLEMNKIPMESMEKSYWRRRLPSAFRFYLEMLSRELLCVSPSNTYAFSAGFFEELLIQRDTELSLLPYESYLDKIMRKRGWEPRAKLTRPYYPAVSDRPYQGSASTAGNGFGAALAFPGYNPRDSPMSAASPLPSTSLRCARCGGFYCSTSSPAPAPAGPVGTVSPITSPAPRSGSVTPCARCSEIYGYSGGAGAGVVMVSKSPVGERAVMGVRQLDDEFPKYNIIAIPFQKDAWGKLTRGRYKDDEFGDLINSRSLSILVDY